MTFEQIRACCLDKPGAREECPLGNGSYYYKVADLVFAIVDRHDAYRLTVKCNPQLAGPLRAAHGCVRPGYHINKEHWNTILMDQAADVVAWVPTWIDDAYALTLDKVSPRKRARLGLAG